MSGDDLRKMEEMLKRHLCIFSGGFQHKLGIVMEGHDAIRHALQKTRQELNEKRGTIMFEKYPTDTLEPLQDDIFALLNSKKVLPEEAPQALSLCQEHTHSC